MSELARLTETHLRTLEKRRAATGVGKLIGRTWVVWRPEDIAAITRQSLPRAKPHVRARALKLLSAGFSAREVARRVGVSHVTITRWARAARETAARNAARLAQREAEIAEMEAQREDAKVRGKGEGTR